MQPNQMRVYDTPWAPCHKKCVFHNRGSRKFERIHFFVLAFLGGGRRVRRLSLKTFLKVDHLFLFPHFVSTCVNPELFYSSVAYKTNRGRMGETEPTETVFERPPVVFQCTIGCALRFSPELQIIVLDHFPKFFTKFVKIFFKFLQNVLQVSSKCSTNSFEISYKVLQNVLQNFFQNVLQICSKCPTNFF